MTSNLNLGIPSGYDESLEEQLPKCGEPLNAKTMLAEFDSAFKQVEVDLQRFNPNDRLMESSLIGKAEQLNERANQFNRKPSGFARASHAENTKDKESKLIRAKIATLQLQFIIWRDGAVRKDGHNQGAKVLEDGMGNLDISDAPRAHIA